ncbi:MAG: hypothetical protein ACI4TI_01375 [Christensenellales bacterium]
MKELFKYQEKDVELKKVEKKVMSSEFMKNINQSKACAKKCQTRMIEINAESKKICDEIEKINSVKLKGLDVVQKYLSTDTTKLDEKSVLELVNKIKPVNKNLEELILRLNNLDARMKNLLNEFNECKKQIIASKKIHDENKLKIDELQKTIEPELEKAKQELQIQEKNVNPELLQKYRNAKREGIFPVLVKLQNGKNCGYCRVEQPIHKLEKMKVTGYTECEQCHRINLIDD